MSQCTGKTKLGSRCTRTVKVGNLCFQHHTGTKNTTNTGVGNTTSVGRKIKLNKGPCMTNPERYVWVVGKGCFEKSRGFVQQKKIADDIQDLRCKLLKCVRREGRDKKGIEVMIFPKDYYLFRSAVSENFYRPSWYSNESVALGYHQKGTTHCKRFVAKRDIKLINIGDLETVKAMLREPSLTEHERNAIHYVTGVNAPEEIQKKRFKSDLVGKGKRMIFSPAGFIRPEDIQSLEYANIKFAKTLCKFGYDGWVIPNNMVIDGSGGHFFSEEVMLCDPGSVLIPTGIDCM